MFNLEGKKALVTGATQGIGYEIAKCLSAFGATVFINGLIEEKVNKAVSEIPNSIAAVCDLSLPDCAEILYKKTGNVDILVSNVSVQHRQPWYKINYEEFDEQVAVNLKAPLKLIQKYAPYMKQQCWGRIITIGSVQEKKPHKDMLIYAALKAAQTNMVKNLAKQFAPYGVTVNNVAPGVIITPRNHDALADKDYANQVLQQIPCGYAGEPEDCAPQVLLLCSDAGRYITGTNIFIDGGMKL